MDGYEIFFAAAEEKSITAAAKRLFLSQPSVSRSVARLEEELGCRLFVRGKKGVQLTPEGELLFAHIARARAQLAEAREEIAALGRFQKGTVRIGASEMTLHHFLLPLLEPFCRQYPGLRLKLANGSTPQISAGLRSGTLDLAVLAGPIAETLTVQKLRPFRDIVVAGPEILPHLPKNPGLSELSRFPLIMLDAGTSGRAFWEKQFAAEGVPLLPDIELATADLVVPVAAHNLGVGFVPEPFAAEALRKGELFPVEIKNPPPERWICAVYDERHPLSAAAAEMLRMLTDQGE